MSIAVVVPSAGESISEGELGTWIKNNGDYVSTDEVIAEVETEKASMEVRAPSAGVLKTLVSEGSTVSVGSEIATITVSDAPKPADAQKSTPTKETKPGSTEEKVAETNNNSPKEKVVETSNNSPKDKHPTPAARKMLTESNIPLDDVLPSGPAGRVNVQDVMSVSSIASSKIATPKVAEASAENLEASDSNNSRATSSKKMSLLRRTLSNRLSTAQKTAALLTTFNEVNMAPVMDLRKKYKEKFKETYDVSLGFMSFFVKAVTNGLEKFPVINSFIEEENVVSHNFADIGIAVSTPRGLVVPVIRNAQSLSFSEIERNILSFAVKGKEGKLSVDDLSGGTFTITNGGTFGSMLSTPIVNFPQSAILGMHNIVQRPVAENGEVVIRPIMYVALTYDHRLIDGADAVRFLYTVKESLEDPARLLLQL